MYIKSIEENNCTGKIIGSFNNPSIDSLEVTRTSFAKSLDPKFKSSISDQKLDSESSLQEFKYHDKAANLRGEEVGIRLFIILGNS